MASINGEEYVTRSELNAMFADFRVSLLESIRDILHGESEKEKIVRNVDEEDITKHLRRRLKKEHKKKEKAEARLYTIIKVARNEDLAEQIGRDIYFDLVDHDKVRSFRIQKHMPFYIFKEEVAKEFGIPVQFLRFWLWAQRENHTYRPDRPLTHQEESQSVGKFRKVSNKAHNAELELFLEIELAPDLRPIPPLEKTKEDILLFFKLYDPVKEELRYVGSLFVKGGGKPTGILTKLNGMAGFSRNEEIELYEEIRFEPTVWCEHIDKKLTFRASQLQDGDIICFQKSPIGTTTKCRYPDVPSFLEYVHNPQVVHFQSLEKPTEEDFCLELSKLFTYDDVVERVARQLGLDDPSKIRLTSHNCYSKQPKRQPIKHRGVDHLSDMLVHCNQTSDILYYEVLDIPLPELQGLKTLKVAFYHSTKDEVVIHSIRLPKQSTVGDVINDMKTKVELSHPNAELRLLEVFYHKIYKIFPPSENIENINDQYCTLRAEEIPEEEKNLGPHDRLIHVYHFTKDATQNQMQVQNFGEPFFLVIHVGETLAEVKVRIQKKLQVPDYEFPKWKFAFMSLGRLEYLQDSDIVSRFQRRDVYRAWEQYLGLEHSHTAPKRAYTTNQMQDTPSSSRFTWTIENFSKLNTKKLYSQIFLVGGCKWQILIFPKGNNVDHLSMYLVVADSATLPYGWSRYAQFSLAVINQIHNKYTIIKETHHQFEEGKSDWGFPCFVPLSELYDLTRGYLVNDTCIVVAEVVGRRVADYWTYDSKKETSYVGLEYQGATCYMNSFLQTLYHIPYFRKAVYHMPTTENDMPSGSIPLALQSLFYKLQYSDNSVSTKELTKSFGWDTYDSFMQHDVQELNRVLCEKLEDKMKGTVVEGTIQQLFEGHHMNYIECIKVDYKSTQKKSFYDLQLDVKGCRDVYASFDKYVEVEHLEGDNKYHAEQHGLQDAKKGALFIDFPPVLQLQLKRFEYDFTRDAMVKINDRYEFPLQLDLDKENGKYLSPEADRRVRNLYTLHSVLVHSGGVHGGHYHAFIRPTLSDQWFKFDDKRVTKENMKRALEEQYGCEEELPPTNPGFNNTPFKFTKCSNAYMLVYIRESDKERIICNVDEKDIAEHLRTRLKKEQEEKQHKKKEKAAAHL